MIIFINRGKSNKFQNYANLMIGKKLYETLQCTICLEDLSDNLSVSSCGHVFHTVCLSQSIEYRSQCPLCRKKITNSSMRELNFKLETPASANEDRIKFLDSLKEADQDKYLALIAKNEEMFKTLEKQKVQLKSFKEDIETRNNLLSSQSDLIKRHNDEKSTWKIEKQGLILEKEAVELENEKLEKMVRKYESDLKEYEGKVKDYERLKKYEEYANDNEDEYFKSLREKFPYHEQAKTFYEIIRMKKGELKSLRKEYLKVFHATEELMDLKKKNYGLELVVDKKDTEIEVLKIELAKYKAQAEKSRQTTKEKISSTTLHPKEDSNSINITEIKKGSIGIDLEMPPDDDVSSKILVLNRKTSTLDPKAVDNSKSNSKKIFPEYPFKKQPINIPQKRKLEDLDLNKISKQIKNNEDERRMILEQTRVPVNFSERFTK